ncbi:MAG: AAA family ATPase [Bacteroidales bacterium]|nr:AAA family ATPase [Bacteroidales bacterium]
MQRTNIIGREDEQKILEQYLNSGKAELIAIYGRRRVGKTYLIKSFFDDKFDFAFTGLYDVSRGVQLSQFQKFLAKYSDKPINRFRDWFEAFDALAEYLDTLDKERIIVFFDEIPWMDTPKSNFLAAFSQFWNDWAAQKNNFKLFVCGSATTWMVSKFIGNKGGIYGRISRSIWLRPFSLGETEQFLRDIKGINMSRHQLLQAYMIFGGIPYYLDMLDKTIPFDVCVDSLLFKQGAPLRMEFDFLFRTLFKEAKIYRSTVEAIAQKLKGLTRAEIINSLNISDGGMLTEILDNLEKCDFIRRYTAIGKTERDSMYQLTDLFSLFYLKFVASGGGQEENLWSKLSGKSKTSAWSGYAFEQVCLHHIPQIKKTLSIGGIISNVHSWSCRPFTDKNGTQWQGGQIDLLIDRSDEVINICEIKYVKDEFAIDADYDAVLRRRATLFATVTKTKKAIYHTFITTYGVARNNYSGIVQSEVTADDLFS